MNNNITRFVLLFEGRTGSTFIMTALDSHPNIISKGEILVGKNARKQEKIIRKLYDSDAPNVRAIGFKTKLRDIADTTRFLELMDEFGVKVIFMYRRNLIKLALSRLNGKRLFAECGKWNLGVGQKSLPPFAPSVIEFEEALDFRRQKEQELEQFMQQIKRPLLVRYYEDLLDNKDKLFADYCSYIGVSKADLISDVIKNTDDDMRKVLLNYDEIKQHYQGSIYENMFE